MEKISPLIFGGKIWQNQSAYTVYALKDMIQQHFPAGHKMFWILGTGGDDAADWRWDDNSHSSTDSSTLNVLTAPVVSAGNTFGPDEWSNPIFVTDLLRSYKVVKTSGNPDAHGRAFLNTGGEPLPLFLRFDLGISSEASFSVTDPWIVVEVTDTASSVIFTVRLNNSRQVELVQGANTVTSPALDLDKMYAVEVKRTATEMELWVQETGASPVSRGTISGSFGSIRGIQMGCKGSSVSAGIIYIDAVRMDSVFVGTDVQLPWNHTYIMHVTGDHGWKTWEDCAKLVESVGGELFFVCKMHNTSTVLTNKLQYWKDFVSYMFGIATSPQDESNFDFNHDTAGQNWANLRYFRGRQAPWPFKTLFIGAEPYFLEGYTRGGDGTGATEYANDFVTRVTGLKEINSAIKCLGHADSSQTFPDYPFSWEFYALPIMDTLVDGLDCFHDYIRVPGSDENTQLKWLLGGWDADEVIPGFFADKAFPFTHRAYFVAYSRDRYPVYAPNAPGRMLGITEWGYQITLGAGQGNHLGWTLMRASHLARAIKDDYDYLGHWLYCSEAGHTEGIVSVKANGTIELTPSFYLYKIASRLANSVKCSVALTQTGNTRGGVMQGFTFHPLSVVAGRLSNVTRVFTINRSSRRVRTRISFTLPGGFTMPTTGTLIKIGGIGHTWRDDNATNPNNIIDVSSEINVSNPMVHTFDPWSINMIEVTSL